MSYRRWIRLLLTTRPASRVVAALLHPISGDAGRIPDEDQEGQLLFGGHGSEESLGGPGLACDQAEPAFGGPELLTEWSLRPFGCDPRAEVSRFSSFNMSKSRAWSATIRFHFSNPQLLGEIVFMPSYWIPTDASRLGDLQMEGDLFEVLPLPPSTSSPSASLRMICSGIRRRFIQLVPSRSHADRTRAKCSGGSGHRDPPNGSSSIGARYRLVFRAPRVIVRPFDRVSRSHSASHTEGS